jgi:cytochrome P450
MLRHDLKRSGMLWRPGHLLEVIGYSDISDNVPICVGRRCALQYMKPHRNIVRNISRLSLLRLSGFALRDPIGAMRNVYDRYGPLVTFELYKQRFIIAVGPKYNQRVLQDPETFHSSGLMLPGPKGSAHRRIRAGIVGMNGPAHLHYRRILQPSLRRVLIDGMVQRMGEIVDLQIRNWPRDERVDLWPLAQRVAQRVAAEMLFGAQEGRDLAKTMDTAHRISEHIRIASSLRVRACPINLPRLPYWQMLRNAKALEPDLRLFANSRRGDLRSGDLLSLIANSPDPNGHEPTDQRITSHVLTLFGASYETCQTALTWTLFLLAQHPNVARTLLDELSTHLGSDPVSASRLEQCHWLDAVIKESMRLLPPIPIQIRRTSCYTDLVDCEVGLHTRVVLSQFLTNRLPELYPDADRFRPERWSSIDPSQYEYPIFSAGPRTCIGSWFGMTFLKVTVAQILRCYRLTIVPGSRIDRRVAIAMWPSRGVPVTLHFQDRRFQASPISGNIRSLVRFDQ